VAKPSWQNRFASESWLIGGERGLDSRSHVGHVLGRCVLLAGPIETLQAVLAPTGDDVNVEVRNALAHPVVHRDPGAVCFECVLYSPIDALNCQKESGDLVGGNIGQGLVMVDRDDENMAGKDGDVIEKGDGLIASEHNSRCGFTGDDRTEHARWLVDGHTTAWLTSYDQCCDGPGDS
jgi:hypothetical protein